ncbi:MAG: GTPase HflX, partial [Desulfovibrio sp.]|nr:GTPase HflX [Desulfovibrio sp.]
MASKVQGNITGLKPSQIRAVERLYARRYPALGGYTVEQARELAVLSAGIGRQIGLLIDRKGRPAMVI